MRIQFIVVAGLCLLLAACGGSATPEPTLAPVRDPYPAGQATIVPLPPTSPPDSGYPAADQLPTPAFDAAYPGGGTVWVWRPVALQQCGGEQTYPDLDSAVAALEGAGITVLNATTAGIAVCEACDCPSSEHYRAEIPLGHLATAEGLGWGTR